MIHISFSNHSEWVFMNDSIGFFVKIEGILSQNKILHSKYKPQ